MDRTSIHSHFCQLFASVEHPPEIAKDEQVAHIEKELATQFPDSYVQFITTIGSVYTPSILSLVTGGESEEVLEGASFDVQNFIPVDRIAEDAAAHWEAGMPDCLVPIASDCMGNVFGFIRTERTERPNDLPLHIFDHDFGTVEEEQGSFDRWLESFIELQNKSQAEQGAAPNP